MDPNASSRRNPLFFKRLIQPTFIVLLVGVLAFPTFFTHFVIGRSEKRLGLEVRHKPIIVLVPGRFQIKPASVVWKDRLEIKSGSLRVRFPVTALFLTEYPIQFDGKDLVVGVAKALERVLGQREVKFMSVSGELDLKRNGQFDIRRLDAVSETVEFHLNGRKGDGSVRKSENT